MKTPGGALLVVLVLTLIAASPGAQCAVTIVSNTQDSGNGSLRDTVAGASAGDKIEFNIPTSDPGYDPLTGFFTITLISGEIVIQTDLTIANASGEKIAISGNQTSRILHVMTGSVMISDLSFINGKADGAAGGPNPGVGGAILNEGTLGCTRCTFANNRAVGGNGSIVYCSQIPPRGGDGEGGAIGNRGALSLVACTLAGNSAVGGVGGVRSCGITSYWEHGGGGMGGAIFNGSEIGSALSLINCTITGNTASSGVVAASGVDARGGGIASFGSLSIFHSTLVDNMTMGGNSGSGASLGGGLYCDVNSTTILGDVILARNAAATEGSAGSVTGPDAAGPLSSQGHNLLGRSDGCTGFTSDDLLGGTTDETRLDPMLGPLSNQGGPTQTLPLLPGSPAIDAGSLDDGSRDQRYYERTGPPDIGAFEYQGTQPVRLANISTRLLVGVGDNAMIGGFIVTGAGPKTVIVRGIGPSLPSGDALANPIIEVHGSSGELLVANDDWRTALSSQEIIGSGLPPGNDLESAWWGLLNPGAYSVIVRGQNDSTGIALFEVYDLDQTVDSKLANVSTRGFVGTGDNVMIGGTIIVGSSPRVLFRALGPSLTGLGVPDALGNPTMELYDGNGQVVAANDNWRDAQEADIIATGIPPSNNLESAIVQDLAPGSYTAVVRGNSGATGVALIEVYDVN